MEIKIRAIQFELSADLMVYMVSFMPAPGAGNWFYTVASYNNPDKVDFLAKDSRLALQPGKSPVLFDAEVILRKLIFPDQTGVN